MDFSEKMRDIINQGMDLSKDMIGKASVKAKELGELGVLALEIMQLKAQAKKISAQLGVLVYAALVERAEASVTAESQNIKETLLKLDGLHKDITSREAEFQKKGGKKEDLDKVSSE
jgi:hypothetical protein